MTDTNEKFFWSTRKADKHFFLKIYKKKNLWTNYNYISDIDIGPDQLKREEDSNKHRTFIS